MLDYRSPQDAVDAVAYWKNHEFKKFAVDVTAGSQKRPTYARTWYCRARSPEEAIECVKRNAYGLPARAQYVAKLAGPRQLGCVRKST